MSVFLGLYLVWIGQRAWCRYDSEEDLAETLQLCYWSLWECGASMIAEGRLLDILRRLHTFGLSLLKMDLRQDGARHAALLSTITSHLQEGEYAQWPEEQKMTWLVRSPCPC